MLSDEFNKVLAWRHADCISWSILLTYHTHPVVIVIILTVRKEAAEAPGGSVICPRSHTFMSSRATTQMCIFWALAAMLQRLS